MYDAIIIGGGHNGLVTAAYLAKAGRKVLVFERREVIGGACVTEPLWPGYHISTAAYVVSLLLPEIVTELELSKYGYEVLPRNPSSFTPLLDGRSLLMGADQAENVAAIAQFSQADAEAFPRYERLLERIAESIEPVLSRTPPNLLPLPKSWRSVGWMDRLGQVRHGYSMWQTLDGLGLDLPESLEFLTGAARTILDRWFESDVLKSTLATDAIIGTFQPISAPGTAYVLLHHVMGMAGGARGVWGYVRGGMGRLSEAIARSAESYGAEIRTHADVARILVQHGHAAGVRLADGSCETARIVISNADANVTFNRLLSPDLLPQPFAAAVNRLDYSSASLKINLAVSELPDFTCRPGHDSAQPHHRGTIHIGTGLDYLERAYDEAKYGRPSSEPIIEMTIPSSVDDSIAPPGKHVISLFVQYAPYRLAGGDWNSLRESYADLCVDTIGRYAPNFPRSIEHRQVLTPVDLERIFGLTGGNIFQGSMLPHQMLSLRPVPGWGDYRTPIPGLYLCGSATHPGGGVTGACGRNAAREILADRIPT